MTADVEFLTRMEWNVPASPSTQQNKHITTYPKHNYPRQYTRILCVCVCVRVCVRASKSRTSRFQLRIIYFQIELLRSLVYMYLYLLVDCSQFILLNNQLAKNPTTRTTTTLRKSNNTKFSFFLRVREREKETHTRAHTHTHSHLYKLQH